MDDRTIALACLFYGFIVTVIGTVSFIVPRKVTDSRVRESLWLLGTFGLLHGFRAWLEVASLLAPTTTPDKTLFLLDVVGKYLNVAALLCLAQFTAEIAAALRRGIDWLRWVPLAGLATWMTTIFAPFIGHRLGWLHTVKAMFIIGL